MLMWEKHPWRNPWLKFIRVMWNHCFNYAFLNVFISPSSDLTYRCLTVIRVYCSLWNYSWFIMTKLGSELGPCHYSVISFHQTSSHSTDERDCGFCNFKPLSPLAWFFKFLLQKWRFSHKIFSAWVIFAAKNLRAKELVSLVHLKDVFG